MWKLISQKKKKKKALQLLPLFDITYFSGIPTKIPTKMKQQIFLGTLPMWTLAKGSV